MAPPTQPANGVLPAPAAILSKKEAPPSNAPRGPASRKHAGPRLKVILRRLPPGLTKSEFEAILGDDWKVGAGKVNWFDFQDGKISKDLSKPSRPARAYLHLTEQAHLKTLSDKVQQCNFTDAKNSARDPALIGPPALEFAPYTRMPNNKKKTDARQGTIDQDPDFIAFLQSLTDPVAKPPALDSEPAEKVKVTTTPLIEHLREKKAAKEKAGKGGKNKQEAKELKAEKAGKKAKVPETPEKGKKLSKAEKAVKEGVTVLNKQAAAVAEKASAASTAATTTPERKPERAPRQVSLQARILQDLGQSPGGKRGKRGAAATTTAANAESSTASAAATQSAIPKKESKAAKQSKAEDKAAAGPSAEGAKTVPTGPAQPTILKKADKAQTPKGPAAGKQDLPKGPKAQSPAPAAPVAPADPASLPKQAFLKHANPSQGITEPLIEEALKAYGDIVKVEIDRKKGFAYVDFADHEGLKKAIAASPVKVAQGAVQVLEKKDKGGARQPPTGPLHMPGGRAGGGGFRGGRSGGGGGRGGRAGGRGGAAAGGNANGNGNASANAAPANPPTAPSAPAAASSASTAAT